jgi:ATP-dependent Clp protease ATP-binding subunit ClpX
MLEIDTSEILFICGGAFVGLDKVIDRRINANSIGFNSKIVGKNEIKNVHKDVTTKDIINFGMIPEFVGRFGMITHVNELAVEDLITILKEPKNSLIRQYQYLFELEGVKLTFDDEALEVIAEQAKSLETNARGLKTCLEKTLLKYQFEVTDLVERGLTGIRISKDTVKGGLAALVFEETNEKKLQQ